MSVYTDGAVYPIFLRPYKYTHRMNVRTAYKTNTKPKVLQKKHHNLITCVQVTFVDFFPPTFVHVT